jgi:hypothetical protein
MLICIIKLKLKKFYILILKNNRILNLLLFIFLKYIFILYFFSIGERYDFVIIADQPVGAYWIQLRGLGECGIKRSQQLALLRYARGPYQPSIQPPTYDFGLPQGVVSTL